MKVVHTLSMDMARLQVRLLLLNGSASWENLPPLVSLPLIFLIDDFTDPHTHTRTRAHVYTHHRTCALSHSDARVYTHIVSHSERWRELESSTNLSTLREYAIAILAQFRFLNFFMCFYGRFWQVL